MDAIGSPTLRAHTILQDRVAQIKTNLDTARIEAVTGKAANVARAVDGDIGMVNRMQKTLDYAKDRGEKLAFEGSRAATAQDALGSVRAQTQNVSNAVISALSGGAPQAITVAQDSALSAIGDSLARLNSDFGGRALFGGDRTGAPFGTPDEMMTQMRALFTAAPDTASALAAIDGWFNDPAGGFATTFYKGGDGDAPTIELAPGERVASTVRGDDSAIRSALHAQVVTALSADAGSVQDRDTLLSAGGTMLRQSVDNVIGLQSQLGVREERMASAQARYAAETTSLGIALNGIVGRDQAEAASEMRQLESQLEAAYLTTSRMANLTLTNFLR